jgi:hypothetical protein
MPTSTRISVSKKHFELSDGFYPNNPVLIRNVKANRANIVVVSELLVLSIKQKLISIATLSNMSVELISSIRSIYSVVPCFQIRIYIWSLSDPLRISRENIV